MDAHYVPSGHLVYGAAGTLRAARFDLARLAVVGTPVPVVPQVLTKGVGAVDLAVAQDGTVVYVTGLFRTAASQALVWIDRQRREEPIKVPAQVYANLRLSPDGTRVALDVRQSQQAGIWIGDLARGTSTRLTFDPGGDRYPVWDSAGRYVFFTSLRAGGLGNNVFRQAADGTGTVERLTESPNGQGPTTISPDGTRLVFEESARPGTTSSDIMMVTLDQERRVQPLTQTPFDERNAEISPDGRWLAYETNESGRFEIFVRPFPDVNGGKSLVSTYGGTRPLWAKSVREIFYVAPSGAVMTVPIESGSTWKAGTPVKLFDWPIPAFVGRSYDVSRDGRRFLMMKPVDTSDAASAPTSLIVVQHFDEELKRLVPTN